MHGQTAVVAGATGLVGSHLVEALLKDEAFEKVVALTRRPMTLQHPKLVNKVVDVEDYMALENSFDKADVIFSAIGTTRKKVKGDLAAYRKVDYDIQVDMAKIGLQKGAKQYILISAVGADPASGNFYLKLKGEVEQAVAQLGYESVYLLRPSILLGKRGEFRLGESIGQAVMQSASFLFFGPMRKYYPVKAGEVAAAMIKASKERRPGVHVWYYNEMKK